MRCSFVLRNNGKLRAVVDARRWNCHFSKPGHGYLCTGEACSCIEIEPGEKIFMASSDLGDAFSHIELPHKWQRFFGMRGVKAKHIGTSSLDGKAIGPETMLFPRLCVCPMVWSWVGCLLVPNERQAKRFRSQPICRKEYKLKPQKPLMLTKTANSIQSSHF